MLDCYDYRNDCIASLANTARHCLNISTEQRAHNNCKMKVFTTITTDDVRVYTCTLWTKSKNIWANTELAWAYGASYWRT